jgi:hypothetical protein
MRKCLHFRTNFSLILLPYNTNFISNKLVNTLPKTLPSTTLLAKTALCPFVNCKIEQAFVTNFNKYIVGIYSLTLKVKIPFTYKPWCNTVSSPSYTLKQQYFEEEPAVAACTSSSSIDHSLAPAVAAA